MLDFIENNDISESVNYNHIITLIDIDNYIDYQIAKIFVANTDWPGHNIDFWRKRTNEYDPNASYGHDGRWRWMFYDADFGFGLWGGANSYQHNTLEFATAVGNPSWPNPDWSTLLFRSLLENDTFRHDFIDRFEYHLLSTFNSERMINIIDSIAEIIEPVIPYHSHRWNRGELSIGKWQENINVMREFAEERPCAMRNIIIDFFEIENDYYAIGACDDITITERVISQAKIRIYPNPAQNKLFINFVSSLPSDIHIEIHDNTGRKKSGINKKPYNNYYQLDVSGLEAGLYLISVVTDNFTFTERVIVM